MDTEYSAHFVGKLYNLNLDDHERDVVELWVCDGREAKVQGHDVWNPHATFSNPNLEVEVGLRVELQYGTVG